MTTDTLSALTTRIRSKDHVDYGLLWGLVVLGITGIVVNYSASRQQLINAYENPHYYLERQALFVILGFIAMFIVARIDYRRYEIAATPLYVFSLFALGGVFVIGQSALGAAR
jgi:cell division protein FtsW (lipid II flippase)